VSPAFKRWSTRNRLNAWVQFLSCCAFVLGLDLILGWEMWRFAWLYPFLAFAWVWSPTPHLFIRWED
jgi:hypothetical protein